MASLQKFFFGARLTVVLLQLLIVSSNLIINRAVVAGEVDSPVVTITSTTAASPMPAAAPAPAAADSENKFLKYLFNKYGSKGVISFEGLEHLMHSLGLGGLDFTGSHTLKEHRPDGYDFGDYDVYDGVGGMGRTEHGQHDQHQHLHDDHHAEEHETPEPPVITFATATVTSTDRRHRHRPEEEQQDHGRGSAVSAGETTTADSRQAVNGTNSTAGPYGGAAAAATTLVQDRNPPTDEADDHVWQEIIFKDMHDPRHRHPRNKNVPFCLSPMSIVHLVMEEPLLAKHQHYRKTRSLPSHNHNAHGSSAPDVEEIDPDARIEITPSEFKDLCPAFLVQLDQRACSQKLQKESNPHRERKAFSQAWIYATACVLIISLCGLVGVAMVPLAKSIAYDDILRFLIALGVGTLCGDALMHLLPHALLPHGGDEGDHEHHHGEPHDDHGGHDHAAEQRAMWLCLCAFGTAFFMYSLEMILPLFREGGADDHHHHHHGHSHAHSQSSNRVEPRPAAQQNNHQQQQHHHHPHRGDDIELDLTDGAKDKEAKTMLQKKSARKPMAAVAFMVVLGDGLHNITDGLAIGAAFAVDPVTGLATSFAILCHELPHELGDFALLLQTGVSIRRAIFLNIVSSILSFVGMALGLLLTGLHESVVGWIYAGTAGTFLYIALSDLVPEMRNDVARSDQKLKVILIQLAGLALGAVIMLLIALNESALQMLFD
ncbi:zinc transporter ZIP10 [Anopheles arabiensis]|uniref:Zinc transporter n=1 Tax=Anopheles arabiensis TaxID=7173 RepID=A0A182HXZ9_ANOAR|nr:zinc transporter ZIP10 [Anopheles arabiensis]